MAAIRVWRKWIHSTIGWRRDEHETHKHAHGLWILCSVSRVRSKTMHSCLHRFEIFSALEQSRTALLGCRLAASRLREAACWQLQWGRLLLLIGAKTNHYGTWYWIYWHCGYSLCDSLSQSWDTGLSVALFISVVITSSTKSMVSFTTPWTW